MLKKYKIKYISIVGGVSCNKRFRNKGVNFANANKIIIDFPEMQYCTDNGAMIAMAAYLKIKDNSEYNTNLNSLPIANLKYLVIILCLFNLKILIISIFFY